MAAESFCQNLGIVAAQPPTGNRQTALMKTARPCYDGMTGRINRPSGVVNGAVPPGFAPFASAAVTVRVGESTRTPESSRIGPSDDIQKSVV
jgi:hypothetical protein